MNLRSQVAVRALAAALCAAGPSWTSAFAYASPDVGKPSTPSPVEIPPAVAGDIIVTANKRAQSVRDVGMAITAASAGQLQAQNITSISGLSRIEPSLVATQARFGAPLYTIRGIGYNDFAVAAAPTVSVYVDQIPYTYSALSKAAPLDLERVEILKGPQGTLFGQNATGGAVNYIAAKPTAETYYGLEGTYASFGAINAKGFLSGPVTQTLDARLAFETDQGGAWQKSTSSGDHIGDRHFTRGRLLLDWRPTDKLKVGLNLNGFRDQSEPQAAQATGVTPQVTAGYPRLPNADPLLIGRAYASIVGVGPVPAPTSDRQADWYHGATPKLDQGYYQGAIRAEYTAGPQAVVTYLGAVDRYRQDDVISPTGRTQPAYYGQHGRVASTSHELRLSGKVLGGKLDYVFGGAYSYALTHENNLFYYRGTTLAYSTIALPFLAGLTTGPTAPTNGVVSHSRNETNTFAGFGNLDYHLGSNLVLHGGARYTQANQSYSGCSADSGDGVAAAAITAIEILRRITPVTRLRAGDCLTLGENRKPGVYSAKLDENNVSWRGGVDWHPAPKSLIYVTLSKGYKSGSFPVNAASTYISLTPVQQESVLAYEIGAKTRVLDNHVDIEGAFFYYDYRNKQVASNKPDPLGIFGISNALVNVPKSAEKGAELTVRIYPVKGITISAQGTYLDSYVRGHFLGYDQFSTTPIDLHGERFPNTPRLSLIGNGQYDFAVGDRLKAFLGVTGRYQSRATGSFGTQESIEHGYPSLYINRYALLDLRAGISARDDRWYLQVFGENVTNKYYWTQTVRIFDGTVRYGGRPATFGVKIGYRY